MATGIVVDLGEEASLGVRRRRYDIPVRRPRELSYHPPNEGCFKQPATSSCNRVPSFVSGIWRYV